MKIFIAAILTALLAFALGIYFPWWSIAVAAFIVYAMIPLKPGWAFVSAFLALFFFWGGMAWSLSANNDHILGHRISQVILKKDDPFMLAVVTALIGGVVGGLAGLSGRLFRMILKKEA
ncbi:MAG TPA: hypothetical protein VK166_04685 [Chitinophagaceae bacterium]|nr:hypothetical protein [Chitinophagaceae bacterium]